MIAPGKSSSALVTLELRTAGLHIPLAQMGHDFVIPVESVDVPVGAGEILMTIDGTPTRIPVMLHEGGTVGQRRIALSAAGR